MATVSKRNEYQGLRLVLFTTIYMFHLSAFRSFSYNTIYKWFMQGGTLAVCYFFVLSGFIVAISNKEKMLTTSKSWIKWILK